MRPRAKARQGLDEAIAPSQAGSGVRWGKEERDKGLRSRGIAKRQERLVFWASMREQAKRLFRVDATNGGWEGDLGDAR